MQISKFLRRARNWKGCCLLVMAVAVCAAAMVADARGQPPSDPPKQAVEKFTEVLLRRPRPGTALDRVYSHHVQNQSLKPFLQSLDVADETEDGGKRQMALGLFQLQRGRLGEAVTALEKADRMIGNDAMANDAMASYYLGKTLQALGRTDEAAEAMRRAIDRNPSRREAAQVYLDLGRLHARARQLDRAIATWQQLQTRYPNDLGVAERVAQALSEEREFELALQQYKALARRATAPDQKIRFQVEAAEVSRQLNRSDEAKKQLQSIWSRLRPGSWIYRDVRDRLEAEFLDRNDYDGLIKFYEEQVEKSPDDLASLVRLGKLQLADERFRQARRSLETVIDRAPDDLSARLVLIDVLARSGSVSETAQHFEKLIELDPNNPDHFIMWGQTILADPNTEIAKRHLAAAKVWKRLSASRPHDAVLLARVGKLYASIDQVDEAISMYQEAIDAAPDSPLYRELLGEYLHQIKRSKQALRVWRSMAQGERRGRDSLVRLAEVLSTFKFGGQSLEVWQDASAFDLTLNQRLRYARSLSDSLKYREAIDQLEIASEIAESPDEHERVLHDRVALYQAARMLRPKIAEVKDQPPTSQNLRLLALLYQADGQLVQASVTIDAARKLDPDNINVLLVAAEVAEQQNRLRDAVEMMERVVELDPRFAAKHLRRVVDIYERLQDSPQAIRSAKALIDSNPASTDAYRLFAKLAFDVGQDEDAVTMLRSAIAIAPRENVSRIMLARHLVKKRQIDAAIELYWQAMEHESEWNERLDLIKTLAPLYERIHQIDELMRRIERFQKTARDHRQTRWMIASAWQATGQFKRANVILRQLLVEHPDDTLLLGQIVDNCVAATQLTSAIEFQTRLVKQDDRPGNRTRLLDLQMEAGIISEFDRDAQSIQATKDPKAIALIIEKASARSSLYPAELCRIALERDENLWGIKCLRAQLLLAAAGEGQVEKWAEADRLAIELGQLDLNPREQPPSFSMAVAVSERTRALRLSGTLTFSSGYTISIPPKLQNAAGGGSLSVNMSSDDFAKSVGRILPTIGSPSTATPRTLSRPAKFIYPVDFSQVVWISRAVQIISICKLDRLQGKNTPIAQIIAKRFNLPQTEETNDLEVLQKILGFHHLMGSITRKPLPVPDQLLWRIVELDPLGKNRIWQSKLSQRTKRVPINGIRPRDSLSPLDSTKLEILANTIVARQNEHASRAESLEMLRSDLELRTCAIKEFRLANQTLPGNETRLPIDKPSVFTQSLLEIGVALKDGDTARAEQLVAALADRARKDVLNHPQQSKLSHLLASPAASWLFSPATETEIDFVRDHRIKLFNAWIAHCSRRNVLAAQAPIIYHTVADFGKGSVQVVITQSGSQKTKYKLIKLPTTLSRKLVDDYLVRGLAHMMSRDQDSRYERDQLSLPDALFEHLASDDIPATPQERKLRRFVAALACWWDARPNDCQRQLEKLALENPKDIELQIETARLEIENNRSRDAFERLDRIRPADARESLYVETARLKLASQIGDTGQINASTSKIQILNIDRETRQLLDQSAVVLSTTSTLLRSSPAKTNQPFLRIRQDDKERLRFAKALLELGDGITGSSIAYSVIENRERLRSSDLTDYRQQAIGVIAKAGRLQQLIATTAEQFEESKKSEQLREELAELYVLSGRLPDAQRLWEESAVSNGMSPEQMVDQANKLAGKRRNHQAAMMYLYAFERKPELWNKHWAVFTQAGELSGAKSAIYERLSRMDVRSFSLFSLCNVIQMNPADRFSDSQRQFVAHVIRTHPDATQKGRLLSRFIPHSERESFPDWNATKDLNGGPTD